MIEKKFIQQNVKSLELERYFRKTLEKADYSHTDIKITPLSTKITIVVGKPGIAIGKGGKTIKELTNTLTNKYKIKNPQLDIQTAENPDLDSFIIAKNIAGSLERGLKPGRLINIYLRKITFAGAVGAEITISGKISGSRGRTEKVLIGYIKKCGDMAEEYVKEGLATATLKQGVVGVKVKILPFLPKSLQIEKEIKKLFSKKKAEEKKKEEVTKKEAESKKETEKQKTEEVVEKEDKKKTEKKETKKEKEETKIPTKKTESSSKTKTEKKKTAEKKDKEVKKEETETKKKKKTTTKKEIKKTEKKAAEKKKTVAKKTTESKKK